MAELLHEMTFDGDLLQRGFWLYVWEISPPEGRALYYVGRTGDSSSTNAQSPFNRMSQHLGFSKNSNMLRRHLIQYGVEPEVCRFHLIALGPLEQESTAESRDEHDERRDMTAALEKALAEALLAAGCNLMNRVVSRKPLDPVRFEQVRNAFATAFPQLAPDIRG